MPTIGNDIVDLTVPESIGKSRDGRFLNRVFTPDEKALIGRMGTFNDAVLWALWAGKEGAYKAVSKNNPDISSSPRCYRVQFREDDPECHLLQDQEAVLTGSVETPAGAISFRTLITPSYVHCLAIVGTCSPGREILSRVFHLDGLSDPSSSVRSAANERLASFLGVDPSVIEIRRFRVSRGAGPPRVLVAGQETDIDISLSHDGSYGAFAIRCWV